MKKTQRTMLFLTLCFYACCGCQAPRDRLSYEEAKRSDPMAAPIGGPKDFPLTLSECDAVLKRSGFRITEEFGTDTVGSITRDYAHPKRMRKYRVHAVTTPEFILTMTLGDPPDHGFFVTRIESRKYSSFAWRSLEPEDIRCHVRK